jgi:hypothetical protein
MKHVRNPAGSVVGRTSKTKKSQSLHDPFRDPPFTKFVRSSTFWKTWPSVCFFLLEAGIIALYNRPAKSLQLVSRYIIASSNFLPERKSKLILE